MRILSFRSKSRPDGGQSSQAPAAATPPEAQRAVQPPPLPAGRQDAPAGAQDALATGLAGQDADGSPAYQPSSHYDPAAARQEPSGSLAHENSQLDWDAGDAGRGGGTTPETTSVDDPHAAATPLPGQGWLTVDGVQKSYGKRLVVRNVSLAVGRGESVGLLGPNGAGKTTVFYMITGLVPADAGQIFIDGRNVTPLPMYRRARLGIGYLPQEASIFRGLTVEQNIMAVLELIEPNRARRREQLDSLLEEFRITGLRKSPSIALSGGERRRCEIARALATRPHFMLLDEPFAGIDPIAVGDIQELVRHLTRRGIGVLITDHNVRETLSLIDRAYIVFDGQILTQGNPDEIINNEDVRRVYLGDMFG